VTAHTGYPITLWSVERVFCAEGPVRAKDVRARGKPLLAQSPFCVWWSVSSPPELFGHPLLIRQPINRVEGTARKIVSQAAKLGAAILELARKKIRLETN